METFIAWYSANTYEQFSDQEPDVRAVCAYLLDADHCATCVTPQLLWIRAVRRNVPLLFVVSIVVNIGMWLERYVIVVTSLHRDFIPSSWSMYHGTFWDYATYYGTLGLFFALDVPVHPLPAGDLDHRDARAGARDAGAAGAARASRGRVARGPSTMNMIEITTRPGPLYGLMAEFDSPRTLVEATRHAYERGYRLMDAYTPFPVEGLAEALGFHHNRIPADRADRRASSAAWAASSCSGSRRCSATRSTWAAGRSIAGRRSSRSRSS